MKDKIKNIAKKIFEKGKNIIITSIMLIGLISINCYAGDLANTKLVIGTKKLIDDATSVAIGIDLVVAIFSTIFLLFKIKGCEDEEKVKHKKNLKMILITCILVVVVPEGIKVLVGYYQ